MTKVFWNGFAVEVDESPEAVSASLAAPSADRLVIEHNGKQLACSLARTDSSGPQKALDFAAIIQLVLMVLRMFFPDLGLSTAASTTLVTLPYRR